MPKDVLMQRDWTDEELKAAGFSYYARRKYLVLARELPAEEAPLYIKTYKDEVLIATAGYMICFQAGWRKRKNLYDYFHWPLAPDHFADAYVPWDDPNWKPRKWGIKHLVKLGCAPYYNTAGAWAKKLGEPVWIQGVEHDRPHEVPVGAYLLIGDKGSMRGAPWWASGRAIESRYMPGEK